MSYGHSSHKYCDACYCNELDEAIDERDALRSQLAQARGLLERLLERETVPIDPDWGADCHRARAFLAEQDAPPAPLHPDTKEWMDWLEHARPAPEAPRCTCPTWDDGWGRRKTQHTADCPARCTCPELIAFGYANPARPRRDGDPHAPDCPVFSGPDSPGRR